MKKTILKYGLILASSVLLFSCEKAEIKDGGGKTLIKFTEGGDIPVVIALDVNPTIETIKIANVLRDANSNADLNKDVTITISNNQALLDAYNADNNTNFELLPDGSYTLPANSGVTGSGNTWTLTMPAGEFNRGISVTIDKSLLDLTKSYAFALEVTQTTVGEPSAGTGYGIVNVLIKNQYDGEYTLNGAFYHPTQSPGYDAFSTTVELHTTGPNSVKIYVPEFGGYYGPGLFAGTLNAFGAQEPEYTVNTTTNKVTAQNGYVGAVTFYTMAPGYDSRWEPGTKTMYVKYGYNYLPGPVFDPANNREWTYELVYQGPR